MPRVSVIIPAYQAQDTLERAVKSVQAQTYTDWEIIIIDDGSTDKTSDIAQSLQESDNRIYVCYQENQGPAVARNTGANQAAGDYLAFLDADDEWKPHKLKGQVEILNKFPSIDLVLCDSINVNLVEKTVDKYSDQHKNILNQLNLFEINPDVFIIENDKLHQVLYETNFVNTSTVVVCRSCFNKLEGFNSICKGTEDLDLWIHLAINHTFAYWNSVCAIRYKSKSNVSSRSERWLKELIRFHCMYLESDNFTDLHDISRVHLKLTYRSLTRYYGRQFNPGKAIRSWRESLSYDFDAITTLYAFASLLGPIPFVLGGQLIRLSTKVRSS